MGVDFDWTTLTLEANMPGSPLKPKVQQPPFQMRIMNRDLKHVGFALRIHESFIVMPIHVYRLLTTTIIMQGKQKKLMALPPPIYSRCLDDVVYFKLDPVLLSQIGVTVGKTTAMAMKTVMASIVGWNNDFIGSEGFLNESTMIPYHTVYEGSTQSGFSGAAYYSHNTIYGMHRGAVAAVANVGAIGYFIAKELDNIVSNEAFIQSEPTDVLRETQAVGYDKEQEFDTLVKQSWELAHHDKSKMRWDAFRTKPNSWLDELDEESAQIVKKLTSMPKERMVNLLGKCGGKVVFEPHSGGDREEFPVQTMKDEILDAVIEVVQDNQVEITEMITKFEQLIQAMEGKLDTMTNKTTGNSTDVLQLQQDFKVLEYNLSVAEQGLEKFAHTTLRSLFSDELAEMEERVREEMKKYIIATYSVPHELPRKVTEKVKEKEKEEAPKPLSVEKKEKCEQCGRLYKTVEALRIHWAVKHEVRGEARTPYRGDYQSQIQQQPQMGFQQGYQRRQQYYPSWRQENYSRNFGWNRGNNRYLQK
uniref:C2H2-type domain-containing protein n=1 Tax=Riboviria sp. TaxID=2585031 RepID=A0A8K1U4L2_9VIRU|nr:MAG: hypothetical protein 1 [Riboviria sp.]